MSAIILKRTMLLLAILCLLTASTRSQSLLEKPISLEVNRQRLDQVLEILSNKGNFYFSYNSTILKKDSLITLTVFNKPVRQILSQLLPDHFEFRESGNYIIIRKAPITLTLVTNRAVTEDKYYAVSGYVLDDETGHQIPYASIYDKTLLVSALTNTEGYFKLRIKQKNKRVALTVSKEFYQDTTVAIDPGYNQQITVTIVPVTTGSMTIISPDDYFAPDQFRLRVQKDSFITEYTYTKTDSIKVERTAMGQFLLSAGQRFQSMNLRKFFISRPYQVSLTPGLGTHGKLSAQVSNNFSLNVFGGYNGGVNGFEMGGLFNIDKKNVQYVQIG
ncbi:MAG TPA: carboxypeptidase-like regulatory domain-containing protein, partial [Flavisolibacter sp.]|nr:carboxypeptidase-like regulatory domain-containing protein [Flavisolibacter sp.]